LFKQQVEADFELLKKRNCSTSDKDAYIQQELEKLPDCLKTNGLEECFRLFELLHRLIDSRSIVERIVGEVLDDFLNDNVVYLELRTTPRCVHTRNKELVLTKRDYLNTILDVIDTFHSSQSQMLVRVLLSIDRTKSLEDALDTVDLARELKHRGVVGLDFCGDPKISHWTEFESVFELAKRMHIPCTVHVAEIWHDSDLDFILRKIRPERIGHAVCLTQDQIEYLLENKIPIEICPTSNLTTECVESIDVHIFNEFYSKDPNYPLVICTDDLGIFNTQLTREYFLISKTFQLNLEKMLAISRAAIHFMFDQSPIVKSFVQEKLKKYLTV
jgi:adenosine deaminase